MTNQNCAKEGTGMTEKIRNATGDESLESTIYFNKATAEANAKVRVNFERIKEACDALARDKAIIGPASIGRWCENTFAKRGENDAILKKGSPTQKTINNNRYGYKTYIQLRAEESEIGRPPALLKKQGLSIHTYPEENLSFVTKTHINNLRSEITRLKREVSIYENRFKEFQSDKPIELEKLIALASLPNQADSVSINELMALEDGILVKPTKDALAAIEFILFEFHQTGLAERMPTDTTKIQQTWRNALTKKPIFSVKQYRALLQLFEGLKDADT